MPYIDAATLLTFVFTSVVIELTPGPNMAYLAILTSAEGRRAGFSAVAGVAAGLFMVGLATAAGLAAVITESDVLYQLLRWGGVVYLLWLAREGWQGDRETSPGKTDAGFDMRFFYRGVVTNLLNPKAVLFYIAILPSFIDPARPLMPQAVLLTGVYVIAATGIHSLIVVLANASRRFFGSRNPLYVRRVLACLLALVALWFAWKMGR